MVLRKLRVLLMWQLLLHCWKWVLLLLLLRLLLMIVAQHSRIVAIVLDRGEGNRELGVRCRREDASFVERSKLIDRAMKLAVITARRYFTDQRRIVIVQATSRAGVLDDTSLQLAGQGWSLAKRHSQPRSLANE